MAGPSCSGKSILLRVPARADAAGRTFSALGTGLRADTRRVVASMLAEAGTTTMLVTHDQEEAMSFADRLAVLHHGRLLQAGPPRTLYLRPADEFVARFPGAAARRTSPGAPAPSASPARQ